MKKFALFFCMVGVLHIASHAQIQYRAPSPSIGLTQHSGVSLSEGTVTQSALASTQFQEPSATNAEAAGSRSTINSFESLFEATGFDVSLSARFASVSGSASFSKSLETAYQKNSFIYTINFKQVFEWTELKDISIKPEAKSLLAENQVEAFVAKYGDHYVSRIQKGNIIAVNFIVEKLSQSRKDALSAALDVAYEGLTDSASLKSKFSTLANKFSGVSNVRVEFSKIGSAPISAGKILTSANIDSIASEVGSCIDKMDLSTAAVVGIELTPYPDLKAASTDSLLGATWNRVSLRAANIRSIKRIQDAQDGYDGPFSWVTTSDRNQLSSSLAALEEQNKQLTSELRMLRKLKSDREWADKEIDDPKPVTVRWPRAVVIMQAPYISSENGKSEGRVLITGGNLSLTAYAYATNDIFATGQIRENSSDGQLVRFVNWNSNTPAGQYVRVFGPKGQSIPEVSENKWGFTQLGTIAEIQL